MEETGEATPGERFVLPPPPGFRRLRLAVEYDGSAFLGWQVQPEGRTVQGALEAALVPLGPHGRVVAAGRTDAGVHARRMPAHVDVAFSLPPGQVLRALNARLPEDARVLECQEAPPAWHARFSCRWRAYRYRILNRPVSSPLERCRALWVPQPLDSAAMREAVGRLVGRHDFAAFATQEERQTEREVLAVRLDATRDGADLLIAGESFLRHMVRGITGTLVQVGLGKLDATGVEAALASRSRAQAGPNVGPQGLYFEAAGYDPWSGWDGVAT
ncbi:MAG TPA: tRNA pseudouridine(38-40) synthase TruA [Deinococcales bacterium]|nr:tRNA pseudouridine(38-40) synthase TruA [Deinococcales bacterium]